MSADLRAAVEALADEFHADGIKCPCGHYVGGEHNGRGCYAVVSYVPLVRCECALTDDRDEAEIAAARLRALLAEHPATSGEVEFGPCPDAPDCAVLNCDGTDLGHTLAEDFPAATERVARAEDAFVASLPPAEPDAGGEGLTETECGEIVRASIAPNRVLNGPVPRDGHPADVLLTTVERIVADRERRAETRGAVREVEAVARKWQLGGWTILTDPPKPGAITALDLGQRVTDWLRAEVNRIEGGDQ